MSWVSKSYEKLALIADAAKQVVRTIRRCLPVFGETWIHAGSPNTLPLGEEVVRSLNQLERLLNPRCLPFDHPERREEEQIVPIPLTRPALGTALGTLIRCHDQILQFYEAETEISTATSPPGFRLEYCTFLWWWPWDGPDIDPGFLEDLDRAADCLLEMIADQIPEEPPEDTSNWHTVQQVATVLGKSPSQISRDARTGKLRSFGEGKSRRIDPLSVINYLLDRGRRDAKPETDAEVKAKFKRLQRESD